ncbi:hypothetical protein ABE583_18820 [Stenotrophomonas sp. TWI143]|uniref:hypothetical protein n=1 Tax=Stenotrophomonas TaxID=40323 RepID=UPI000AE6DC81|nr:hypothetical protein [Stenotrophomonas maltophilia]UXY49335.1 hypothetical protein N8888_05195 [Stenotrophomonas maltophilia]HDS1221270.1 hypothetical protein [Stenotrophomonas maltophilia]HDS1233982.1 hypothetical protein [Stenotrophomonas maltophilia]
MRVKVIDDWESVLADLGAEGKVKPKLFVARGKEYTVYGLSLHRSSSVYRAGALICQLVDDYGNLIFAPIGVFDVIDGAIPDFWRIEVRDGDVLIWPDIFYKDFFFDDLSDGVPECVAAFRNLQSLMGNTG